MAHYDDLALCDYFGELPTGQLLAVGWLEPEFAYRKGDPGKDFYERLKQLLTEPWQPVIFGGEQVCRFCRYDGFYSYQNLFIPGRDVTYAAPEGILHYIAVHDYHPPAEFCEAVIACPDMGSTGYFEALQSCGWSQQYAHIRPADEEAAWKASVWHKRILEAVGDAIVTRIEAHWELKGHLPNTLTETDDLIQASGQWRYNISDQSYELEFDDKSAHGVELIWYPQFRMWGWRFAENYKRLNSSFRWTKLRRDVLRARSKIGDMTKGRTSHH